jgi:pilus assembly protein CpaC
MTRNTRMRKVALKMRNWTAKRFVLAAILAVASVAIAQQPTPATNPAPSSAPAGAEAQTLHILAGRSVIVNTQARMKRILVSNPALIETTTVTPTQLVISAKAAGTASLVIWDETGRARIIDVSADVDVSALRNALQQAIPSSDIRAEADQGRVVLTGNAPNAGISEAAVKIATLYSAQVVNSIVVAPTPRAKQILLKVRFAEIDRSKAFQLGINIFSTGATNTIGTISTQQFNPPALTGTIGAAGTTSTGGIGISDLMNIFLFRRDLNLGATIKDLENKNVLQILAEPNLLARSGVPAKFIAGGEFPYPVINGGGGVGSVPVVTITFRPYGVKLEFTGVINPDNTISLKVAPEVSALDYTNSVTYSGFVVPALSTRRAETEVDLKDGQSFGIAGMLDKRTTAQLSKMPGFGDIPILGLLFKSRNFQRSTTELMVIVTPTIVDTTVAPGAEPQTPVMPYEPLDNGAFDATLKKAKPAATTEAPKN